MSVYEDIQARIDADHAADEAVIDGDTLEGARAEIVGDILEIAERWQLKAEEYPPEDHFVHFRAIVCEQVLDALRAELYDEEGSGS
ncbi:hypothetical protein ACFWPK_04435 [Nocardia sp. NPDC058519]|uniref:hypothetical protein n=1 Tax=Nocardia sp. NPDC058519 TaxID=3346535 RepID=UPI0036551B26